LGKACHNLSNRILLNAFYAKKRLTPSNNLLKIY